MSESDEEILDVESLRQLVEERLQSSEAANAACRLAGLSIRGNAAQKRGRLLQFISGAAARRRPGWLDLIMRAAGAGATGPDDLDVSLESAGAFPAQIHSFAGSDDGDGDVGGMDARIKQLEQQLARKETQILDKLRS